MTDTDEKAEMVERVARAIAAELGKRHVGPIERWVLGIARPLARVAITAMRDPTDGMTIAPACDDIKVQHCGVTDEDAELIWRSMIESALG